MSKEKDLLKAYAVLPFAEYVEYEKWRDKPWVERYPYLATLILQTSLLANVISILTLLGIKQ